MGFILFAFTSAFKAEIEKLYCLIGMCNFFLVSVNVKRYYIWFLVVSVVTLMVLN